MDTHKVFCYKGKAVPWQTHAIHDMKQILPSGTQHTFSFQIYPQRIFIVPNNLIQVPSSLCMLFTEVVQCTNSFVYFLLQLKVFREMIVES